MANNSFRPKVPKGGSTGRQDEEKRTSGTANATNPFSYIPSGPSTLSNSTTSKGILQFDIPQANSSTYNATNIVSSSSTFTFGTIQDATTPNPVPSLYINPSAPFISPLGDSISDGSFPGKPLPVSAYPNGIIEQVHVSNNSKRDYHVSSPICAQIEGWSFQSILTSAIGRSDPSPAHTSFSRTTSREEVVSVRFQKIRKGFQYSDSLNIAYENGFQIWNISNPSQLVEKCSFLQTPPDSDIVRTLDIYLVPNDVHDLAVLVTESSDSTVSLQLISTSSLKILQTVSLGNVSAPSIKFSEKVILVDTRTSIRVYQASNLTLVDEFDDISHLTGADEKSNKASVLTSHRNMILYPTTSRQREYHNVAVADMNLYKTAVDLAQGIVKGATTLGSWGRDIYQGYMRQEGMIHSLTSSRPHFFGDVATSSSEPDPGWIALRTTTRGYEGEQVTISKPNYGFRAHQKQVSFLQIDESGMLLFTSAQDGTIICVWDLSDWIAQPVKKAPVCFLKLEKGVTSSLVRQVSLNANTCWLSVLTIQGTIHIYSCGRALEMLASSYSTQLKSSVKVSGQPVLPIVPCLSPLTKLHARSTLEVLRNVVGIPIPNNGTISGDQRSHTRSRSSEDFEHLDVVQVDDSIMTVGKAVQFFSPKQCASMSSTMQQKGDNEQYMMLWNPETQLLELYTIHGNAPGSSSEENSFDKLMGSPKQPMSVSSTISATRSFLYDVTRDETWPEVALVSGSLDPINSPQKPSESSKFENITCSSRHPIWAQKQCRLEVFDSIMNGDIVCKTQKRLPSTKPDLESTPFTKSIQINAFAPQPYASHGTESESRSVYTKLNLNSLNVLTEALHCEIDRPPPEHCDAVDKDTGFSLLDCK